MQYSQAVKATVVCNITEASTGVSFRPDSEELGSDIMGKEIDEIMENPGNLTIITPSPLFTGFEQTIDIESELAVFSNIFEWVSNSQQKKHKILFKNLMQQFVICSDMIKQNTATLPNQDPSALLNINAYDG